MRCHSADSAALSIDAMQGISEAYEGVIDVYETKNKEIVKQVLFSIVICSDADTLKAAKQAQRAQRRLEQRRQPKSPHHSAHT